jgi:NADPH-dependent glutamate synthase beta subunit-like oxidoreductase
VTCPAPTGPPVVRIDEEALDERHLPLLTAQPALGLVEEALDLVMLPCDARHRDPRALPHLVVVDLGDSSADAVLELRLRGAQVVPLLLQRMRLGEVQLTREDTDVAARHRPDSIRKRAAGSSRSRACSAQQ